MKGEPLVRAALGHRRAIEEHERTGPQVDQIACELRHRMATARAVLTAQADTARVHEARSLLVALDVSPGAARPRHVLTRIVDVRGVIDEEGVVQATLPRAVAIVVNERLTGGAGVLRQPTGGVDQERLITDHHDEPTGAEELLARVRGIDVGPTRERAPNGALVPSRTHGDVRRAGREVRQP